MVTKKINTLDLFLNILADCKCCQRKPAATLGSRLLDASCFTTRFADPSSLAWMTSTILTQDALVFGERTG